MTIFNTVPYRDMHGNLIEVGDTIRNITDKTGKEELVYLCADEENLGINASNEKHKDFMPQLRKLYPLNQFDLENEWEIVKKHKAKED